MASSKCRDEYISLQGFSTLPPQELKQSTLTNMFNIHIMNWMCNIILTFITLNCVHSIIINFSNYCMYNTIKHFIITTCVTWREVHYKLTHSCNKLLSCSCNKLLSCKLNPPPPEESKIINFLNFTTKQGFALLSQCSNCHHHH